MIPSESGNNLELYANIYSSVLMTGAFAGSVALTTYFWQDKEDATSIGVNAFLIAADVISFSGAALSVYATCMGKPSIVGVDSDLGEV
jgi:hypothetical protein